MPLASWYVLVIVITNLCEYLLLIFKNKIIMIRCDQVTVWYRASLHPSRTSVGSPWVEAWVLQWLGLWWGFIETGCSSASAYAHITCLLLNTITYLHHKVHVSVLCYALGWTAMSKTPKKVLPEYMSNL